MPSDDDLKEDADRAVDAVRSAAAEVLAAGEAELTVSTVKGLYGEGAQYDAPVVVLTPRNANSARVTVEVHDGEWTLGAADGPHIELYVGMPDSERQELLERVVRSVVAGQFEYGWTTERRRRLLRPWRFDDVPVRVARFGKGRDAFETRHVVASVPPCDNEPRRFAPYAARSA